jgi:hypothetical protein
MNPNKGSAPTFKSIAASLGIVVPVSLQRMIDDGRTLYGANYQEWQATY